MHVHTNGGVSSIDGNRARLELSYVRTTENFQLFTTTLPDGSLFEVYIPRVDFTPIPTSSNRLNNPREVVMYTARKPGKVTLNPVIHPDPEPVGKKSTSKRRSR